jgi:hypothetical protein
MKTSETKRTVAGLSVALAMVGGLAFGGTSRADASGDFANCAMTPTLCQVEQGPAGGTPGDAPWRGIVAPLPTGGIEQNPNPKPVPYVDLSAFVQGRNGDGSPEIFIRNAGTLDAGGFAVLMIANGNSRVVHVDGVLHGQVIPFHDPLFPEDCHTIAMIHVNFDYQVTESNYGNNVLGFPVSC